MDDLIDFIEEGFEGQRLYRIPESVLIRMKLLPFVRDFVVTDLGWFPKVSRHRVERASGLEQDILIVVEEGSGWVEWGKDEASVEEGQTLLIPAGAPHAYGSQLGKGWSLSWYHFEGRGARDLIALSGLREGPNPINPHAFQAIKSNFRQSLHRVHQGYANSILLELSKSLIQVLSLISSDLSPKDPSPKNSPIEKVIAHMRSCLNKNLSLCDLASLASLSVPQFSHRFKVHTGVSPMQYFTEIRMQKACAMLDQSTGSIGKIAEDMGFSDPLYFSRQFKKCTGLSPRAYRLRS